MIEPPDPLVKLILVLSSQNPVSVAPYHVSGSFLSQKSNVYCNPSMFALPPPEDVMSSLSTNCIPPVFENAVSAMVPVVP